MIAVRHDDWLAVVCLWLPVAAGVGGATVKGGRLRLPALVV